MTVAKNIEIRLKMRELGTTHYNRKEQGKEWIAYSQAEP